MAPVAYKLRPLYPPCIEMARPLLNHHPKNGTHLYCLTLENHLGLLPVSDIIHDEHELCPTIIEIILGVL